MHALMRAKDLDASCDRMAAYSEVIGVSCKEVVAIRFQQQLRLVWRSESQGR